MATFQEQTSIEPILANYPVFRSGHVDWSTIPESRTAQSMGPVDELKKSNIVRRKQACVILF